MTAALFALAGCASPSAASDSTSQALPLGGREANSAGYLYVADRALKAVMAFDRYGNKVAEKKFSQIPFDVVTDSKGHVYVDTLYSTDGTFKIHELTHELNGEVAEYSTPGYAGTMTVDADDNLYVEDREFEKNVIAEDVVMYPYGSTTIGKTYLVGSETGASRMTGISVRGSTLYAPVSLDLGSTYMYECPVDQPGNCAYKYTVESATCGFTTTDRLALYGDEAFLARYQIADSRERGVVDLPQGYTLGWAGFCNLHNDGHLVWGAMRSSTSNPAEAVEVDMDRGFIQTTIGAGYLSEPVAAYNGNGFTP
ncbi:MAG: hypothetical protein JOZ77_02100 [Candidatus Eremiobacteraeota bacterium]|nr:hypothetical protein [Candidatus Eremiobacteraeota bacterium]